MKITSVTIYQCDGCGFEVKGEKYKLPEGWIEPSYDKSISFKGLGSVGNLAVIDFNDKCFCCQECVSTFFQRSIGDEAKRIKEEDVTPIDQTPEVEG